MNHSIYNKVLVDYKVDQYGKITDHGKFFMEPLATPYFWELALHGLAEEITFDDTVIYAVETDEEERKAFSLPENTAYWVTVESIDGFVYGEGQTKDRYERALAHYYNTVHSLEPTP